MTTDLCKKKKAFAHLLLDLIEVMILFADCLDCSRYSFHLLLVEFDFWLVHRLFSASWIFENSLSKKPHVSQTRFSVEI